MTMRCFFWSPRARTVIPEAPVGPRLLEDLEVQVLDSACALPFLPGAPPGQRPFEDFEVPVFVSTRARLRVPGAPVGLRTLATPCVGGGRHPAAAATSGAQRVRPVGRAQPQRRKPPTGAGGGRLTSGIWTQVTSCGDLGSPRGRVPRALRGD